MGNPILLQACLRLNESEIPKQLEIGKEYHFRKREHRLYQINVPMDLRTNEWKALGRCIVTEYTIGKGRTEGTFVMVKIFNEKESQYATNTYVSDEEVNKIINSNPILK
ncbi:MAG: DUF2584 family protein [Candidatus Micrarchaeota archaeon]